jgi:hypothetical protein
MWRLRIVAITALFLTLPGCGGDGLRRVPVRGKLTAKGVPVAHATVQFLPVGSTKGQGALGRSDQEGNFTMASGKLSGVVPGEYKVRLSRQIVRDGSPILNREQLLENPDARESVPRRYAAIESTPLKATVPESGGVVNVEIPEPMLPWKLASP